MIKQNIAALSTLIPANVTIIAVSKAQSESAITEAYESGLTNFGENYLQEALIKIKNLANFPISWHFIGRLQSNKLKAIAENFAWVHTVTSLTEAEKLNKFRATKTPLNICLQINLDDDPAKGGIAPNEAFLLAEQCLNFTNIKLRGLMTILKLGLNEEQQINTFKRLKFLQDQINQQLNLNLDILSMGMSNDYKAAIIAGSNMIRIGTAIFGERENVNYN